MGAQKKYCTRYHHNVPSVDLNQGNPRNSEGKSIKLTLAVIVIYESNISSCISLGAMRPGIESIRCRSLSL